MLRRCMNSEAGGVFLFTNFYSKNKFSSVLPFSRLRSLEASYPALENTHSNGADDAVVHKNCRDSLERFGKLVLRWAKYCKASWVLGRLPSVRYLLTSIIESAAALVVGTHRNSEICFKSGVYKC